MTPEELLPIESSDISTISPTSETEPEKPDSLPRGSELTLITIKYLAAEIKKTDDLDYIREKCRSIEREVNALLARIEKRRNAVKVEAA
jgi:hypothetical protein